MNENKIKELIMKKEQLLKQLDEIECNLTEEDMANASEIELLEFTKLTLQISQKLELIEELEKNIK